MNIISHFNQILEETFNKVSVKIYVTMNVSRKLA